MLNCSRRSMLRTPVEGDAWMSKIMNFAYQVARAGDSSYACQRASVST